MLLNLHAELENTETVDVQQRELLQHLMQDIRNLLDNEDEDETASQRYQSLGERLTASLEYFEASHPVFTTTLTQVADSLARMGI